MRTAFLSFRVWFLSRFLPLLFSEIFLTIMTTGLIIRDEFTKMYIFKMYSRNCSNTLHI